MVGNDDPSGETSEDGLPELHDSLQQGGTDSRLIRRMFLKQLGATAPIMSIAGCTGTSEDEGDTATGATDSSNMGASTTSARTEAETERTTTKETRTETASESSSEETDGVQSTPTPATAKEAARAALSQLNVPEDAIVFLNRPPPGAKFFVRGDSSPVFTLPEEGLSYGIMVDLHPNLRYSHPVKFGWIDPVAETGEVVDADWRPVITADGEAQVFDHTEQFEIDGVEFRATFAPDETGVESASSRSDMDSLGGIGAGPGGRRHYAGSEPVPEITGYYTSEDPPADAKSVTSISVPDKPKLALVIDGGDIDGWVTAADNFAADAKAFAERLRKKEFVVRRVSQYWGNSLPKFLPPKTQVKNLYELSRREKKDFDDAINNQFKGLLEKYKTAFENVLQQKDGYVTFDLYISSHGTINEWGLIGPYGINYIGNQAHQYNFLATELKKFPKCTKFKIFIDACNSGSAIEPLSTLCESHMAMDIITVTDRKHMSPAGQFNDSGTQIFLEEQYRDDSWEALKEGLSDKNPQRKFCVQKSIVEQCPGGAIQPE